MKKFFFIFVFCGFILTFYSFQTASAACVGMIPVFGTEDTKETCKDKKYKKKPAEINNNQGVGSGKNNVNVILDSPGTEDLRKYNERESDLIFTVHQVRIEIAPYVIPGAYQFDTPGTPERFFINGLAYEYYLNQTLGFGIVYQEFSKTNGRNFDPVSYRDSSGDTHNIAFPGAINRLKYRSYIPYVALNAKLSPLWCLGGRFGIGRVEVEAEYSNSQISGEERYEDNTSILFDLFIERWYAGARIGGALRYINAQHETSNYLEYMNLGSAQMVLYVQFTLKTFGVL